MTKMFELVIGSHFFLVKNPTGRMYSLLNQFLNKYAIRKLTNERGRSFMKVTNYYGSRTSDESEYRFHIGQLKDFMNMLDANMVSKDSYDVVNIGLYIPKSINMKTKDGWDLRDYQTNCKEFVLKEHGDDLKSKLVSLPTGTGKLTPLDSKIKIPGGWTTMGEISLNDDIIGPDGSVAKVTGVYPQGIKDVYRITFADGRSVECGLEHLWRVQMATKEKQDVVINTKEIIRLLKLKHYSNRLYIPLPYHEQVPDVKLPIDPYLLGSMIGDGTIEKTGHSILTRYLDHDDYVCRKIKRHIPICCSLSTHSDRKKHRIIQRNKGYKNPVSEGFKQLKLNGKLSHQKFIPEIYLNSSFQQKIYLIRGLMDTDGKVDAGGCLSYSTVSEQLAKDVQYLIRSIGGIAKITSRYTRYTHKGKKLTGKLCYRVIIRYRAQRELVTKPARLRRLKEVNQYSNTLKLRIESIEFSRATETQCIAVSHPSKLYITDDFIVTHNTVVGLSTLATLQQKIFICVLPTYMEKWGKDVTGILNVKPKEIMMIKGSNQLKGLISAAKASMIPQKVFIVSLATMRNYFKLYEESNGNMEELGFESNPDELYELLNIGSILMDEVHQHLHAVYKLISYANTPRVLGLSATLLSDDPQVEHMQQLMFPREIRYDEVKMKKYIKVYAISYKFKDFRSSGVRTTEFKSKNYSHNAFERTVLKRKPIKDNYLMIIADLVRIGYHESFKENDKLIVFASSKIMCQAIVDYLKEKYPEYDTRKYTEEDPYENAIEADIRVTTIASAGTALDIPGLRATILTNSISSSVSNLQCLGRLRELKDRDVKFFYMFSDNIPKQVQYHKNKIDLFYERVASIKELVCPILI